LPSIWVGQTCTQYLFAQVIIVLMSGSRVCEVVLKGDKTFSLIQQKYRVSEALKTGDATALFSAFCVIELRWLFVILQPHQITLPNLSTHS